MRPYCSLVSAVDHEHRGEPVEDLDGHAGTEPPVRDGLADRRRARPTPLRTVVVLTLAASLVGAAAALGVARLTGWGRETVVTRYVQPKTSVIDHRAADIPTILAKVLPGVVSVSATSSVSTPFFEPGGGATTVTATGTGVIVTADGDVVTNDHVVSGARSITISLNDAANVNGSAKSYPATVVGESAQHDLALLHVEGAPRLQPLSFGDSSTLVVGDDVLAVGYALGLSGGPTVTDGIISAKNRRVSTETATGQTVTLTDMVQTDAAISSGNSGGPLVNAAAEVIGINTVVATSSRSTTAQNIGFAISARTVQEVLPQLRSSG